MRLYRIAFFYKINEVMSARIWKILGCLCAAGLLSGFIGIRYAGGFLLGVLGALLLYYRNVTFWNDVLDTGVSEKRTGSLHFVFNYAIMAGVLLLAAFFPDILNIFTAAAGLMIIKAAAVIDSLLPADKNKE